MSLRDWSNNGWIHPCQITRQEVSDLLGGVDRDLRDCQTPGLSADWRLNIAYNAALQAAAAALAAAGFRAARDAYHYRVIQSLAYTVGPGQNLIAQLDAFRKKRHIGGYECAGIVTEREADEMAALAIKLSESVKDWIRRSGKMKGEGKSGKYEV